MAELIWESQANLVTKIIHYDGQLMPATEVTAVFKKKGNSIWAMKTDEAGVAR